MKDTEGMGQRRGNKSRTKAEQNRNDELNQIKFTNEQEPKPMNIIHVKCKNISK